MRFIAIAVICLLSAGVWAQVPPGTARLKWSLPTTNDNGTPLVDLAGFKVYWGTTQHVYPNSKLIEGASVTTYDVTDLAPGKYWFVVTALTVGASESKWSNSVTKTIVAVPIFPSAPELTVE